MEAQIPSVAIRALSPSQPDYPLKTDEVWSINNSHAVYDYHPDLIIAMDDLDRDYKNPKHRSYVESIVDEGCPVLSARTDERWPTVEAYPLKWVLKKLGLDKNAWPLFDNTLNYTFAYALARGFTKIHWFGADWRHKYDRVDLECAMTRWNLTGYEGCPEWFSYHAKEIVYKYCNTEPGSEAFHWWLGYCYVKKIVVTFPDGTTILNRDRIPHWYGFQEQPEI